MVEAIFGVEEGARLPPVLRAAFRKHTDIAASAEATAFAMVDDHRLDGGIPAPPDERVDHRSEERRVGNECVIRVDLGGRRILQKKIKIRNSTSKSKTSKKY